MQSSVEDLTPTDAGHDHNPAMPWAQTVGRGDIRDGRGSAPAPMQSTRGRSRHVATPIHGPPIEGGPPACRLRSIIANATESADGILAKAAPRRGQPAQQASPETIE